MRFSSATRPAFDAWIESKNWPSRWIAAPAQSSKSYVIAYRLCLKLEEPAQIRVHLTADQRYRFFLNGELEGEGPERGDLLNWFYQTYELNLPPGEHTLVALVWTLENTEGIVPGAQISIDHGLMLAADAPFTEMVSTGLAGWECCLVTGVTFRASGLGGAGSLSGSTVKIDGETYPWGVERGEGDEWKPVRSGFLARGRIGNDNWGVLDAPLLKPGKLPKNHDAVVSDGRIRYVGEIPADDVLLVDDAHQLPEDENAIRAAWDQSKSILIGSHRSIWVLVDLEDYYCGFPELSVRGGQGAEVDVLWAEALCKSASSPFVKGNRNEVEGKTFIGRGDTFRCSGGDVSRCFTSFWWSCGRYIALRIRTGAEPLTLYPLRVRESRYPLEAKAVLELESREFEVSKAIMWRAVQMCAHETYMDCPYYEQMNYAADTRVQVLITFLVSGDDRLAKQCIELLAGSLLPTGLTSARYPAEYAQVIPQFSLYWIAMLHDFAMWRGEPLWLKSFLPHTRFVLDTFIDHIDDDGLLRCPDGWNWVDWAWNRVGFEIPDRDFTAVNQLLLINVLGQAGELERWLGRVDVACHYDEIRTSLWNTVVERYWCEARGLFSSSPDHDEFCEHEQCFAVLSGLLDASMTASLKKSLIEADDLERATLYFQHYLFSAYGMLGLEDCIVSGFKPWGEMVEQGLRTTLERSGESRSDCHAWSAHPLYHAAVSIAGIRPAALGFSEVVIAPAVDTLRSASVSVPFRDSLISVAWQHMDDCAEVTVELPLGLHGRLELAGESHPLCAGERVQYRVASAVRWNEIESVTG